MSADEIHLFLQAVTGDTEALREQQRYVALVAQLQTELKVKDEKLKAKDEKISDKNGQIERKNEALAKVKGSLSFNIKQKMQFEKVYLFTIVTNTSIIRWLKRRVKQLKG